MYIPPIIKIPCCFIAGIAFSYFFESPLQWLVFLLFTVVLLLVFSWYRANRRLYPSRLFGGMALAVFFLAGALNHSIRQPENRLCHYTHYAGDGETGLIELKVTEVLKPGLFHERYVAGVRAIDRQEVCGKVLLNINRDSLGHTLAVDDMLLASKPFEDTPTPKNPGQFDYAKYLSHQGIFHQLTIAPSELILEEPGNPTLWGWAYRLREHIVAKLELYPFAPDELAVMKAMLLGQRHDISGELYADYAAAGVIHILAISGLHVGIIMLLLQYLFKPLERLRHGKFMTPALIVLVLWGFALLTGLSASVMRAATMFTFFSIGGCLNRPTNPFNTLASSALVLLIIDPGLLFQVGFQLSYLAVLGILAIYSLISGLYKPRWHLDKLAWNGLVASIAAQIGVLPVSLYYFHQFGGLFFLSNLVIIPLLGTILGLGIGVIVLATAGWLPDVIVLGYGSIIKGLNGYIQWVAGHEGFVFRDVPFSAGHMVAVYILITCCILLVKEFRFPRLAATLIAVISLQGVFLFGRRQGQSEMVLFHKGRHTVMAVKENPVLTIMTDVDSTDAPTQNLVRNYAVSSRVRVGETRSVPGVFKFDGALFLIIDSTGVYDVLPSRPDYLLLRGSPKIHLDKVIEALQPRHVLADGSNYTTFVTQWEATCRRSGIPFHHTGRDGAFRLRAE